MPLTRRQFLLSGSAALVLLAGGCFSSSRANIATPLSPPTRSPNMRYTQWKTWCAGRHLIDLPASARVKITCKIFSKELALLPKVTPEQVKNLAHQKIIELKAEPNKLQNNMFVKNYDLPGGALVYRHGKMMMQTHAVLSFIL